MGSSEVLTDVGGREVQGVPRTKEGEPITRQDIAATMQELYDLSYVIEANREEEFSSLFSLDDVAAVIHAADLLYRFVTVL